MTYRSHSAFALLSFAFAMLVFLCTTAVTPAQGQTFTVLHTFSGGADGGNPSASLTMGGSGTFYGTTTYGGTQGQGVVFKLKQEQSGWTVTPLHEFQAYVNDDGANPLGPVTIGPNGALYGTTTYGGTRTAEAGMVYELQPPPTPCKTTTCYWNETAIHAFNGTKGRNPFYVALIFDRAGNIYGTTEAGGANDKGTVFQLTKSGGTWTENVLYSFNNQGNDDYYPEYGVVSDAAGNLYGTNSYGGTQGGGTVFQLSPSGGGWTNNTLYSFPMTLLGSTVPGAVTMDPSGNLYGPAVGSLNLGGEQDIGSVFQLPALADGWGFSTLYNFMGSCFPYSVTMDAAGNFYGVCYEDGFYNHGMVYKLTNSGGTWTLTDLHDFFGGTDGGHPIGGIVIDANGNLFGTTTTGGNLSLCSNTGPGCGTIWEITP